MRIRKVIETCIYSFDLPGMKRFYSGILGMPVVQEEDGKLIFLQAGKSMLLIFNPDKTGADNDRLPAHGAATPPASVHFAMEIDDGDYAHWKELLNNSKIRIEKEVEWKGKSRSLYFRDPAGNLVELITPGEWPVES